MDIESKVATDMGRKRRGIGVRVPVGYAQQHPIPMTTPSDLVREAELRMHMLGGIGATTLRRMEDEEGFPPAIKITERIRAWRRAEVNAWLASRPTAPTKPRPGAKTGAAARPVVQAAAWPGSKADKAAAVRNSRAGGAK